MELTEQTENCCASSLVSSPVSKRMPISWGLSDIQGSSDGAMLMGSPCAAPKSKKKGNCQRQLQFFQQLDLHLSDDGRNEVSSVSSTSSSACLERTGSPMHLLSKSSIGPEPELAMKLELQQTSRAHWTTKKIKQLKRPFSESHRPSHQAAKEEEKMLLPCHDSPRDAIKRITPQTMVDLLQGKHQNIENMLVVDCRYPYEYHGGHLPSALNVNTLSAIDELLFSQRADHGQKRVIVFHCEFSSERAPRMALHVRSRDRLLHASQYPLLSYPQMYVLEGGYKRFWQEFPEWTEPRGHYVPMRMAEHRDQLRWHQRLRFRDAAGDGKHRHKLHSFSAQSREQEGTLDTVPLRMPLPTYTNLEQATQERDAAMLSSDQDLDICNTFNAVLMEAESLLICSNRVSN